MKSLLFVALGGFFGSSTRFLVSLGVKRYFSGLFPLATFSVNMAGCLLIGFLFGLASKAAVPKGVQLFCMTGFLGSLTTFSTYALDSVSLFQLGKSKLALLNIAANNGVGMICALCGLLLANSLVKAI
jgi:CrcB protein